MLRFALSVLLLALAAAAPSFAQVQTMRTSRPPFPTSGPIPVVSDFAALVPKADKTFLAHGRLHSHAVEP
jgi:hypothetical protein